MNETLDSERRTATRIPAGKMASITAIRLSAGTGNAVLMNISTTGMLVRCPNRLLPGTRIKVTLEGGFQPSSIKGRVARCLVADLCGPNGLLYHVGIAFDEPIALEEEEEGVLLEQITAVEPSAAFQILENRW